MTSRKIKLLFYYNMISGVLSPDILSEYFPVFRQTQVHEGKYGEHEALHILIVRHRPFLTLPYFHEEKLSDFLPSPVARDTGDVSYWLTQDDGEIIVFREDNRR